MQLAANIDAELLDERIDEVGEINRLVAHERSEVHRESDALGSIHRVGFKEGGIGSTATDHAEVVAFAAGYL